MLTKNVIKELLSKGERIILECKEAEKQFPKSVYQTYSAFANTNGGVILLGISEDKTQVKPAKRYQVTGVNNPDKLITDFWNTINGSKVNINILVDEHVYPMDYQGKTIVVIEVPRAQYMERPVYVGENPYKGSYKRNHEGDYHCTEAEVRAFIRDQYSDGNDGLIFDDCDMDDIDTETLHNYRNIFRVIQADHVWNKLDDKEFLQQIGGYVVKKKQKSEGPTMAGLLMFGKGLPIRNLFPMILMDYREEVKVTPDVRWNDRITYDGTWENNLFTFFRRVVPHLTADLKTPFKLEGIQRIDDTSQKKAVREAMVNMIIHADYQAEGTLKVIKTADGFTFSNPGSLKLPMEDIYKGGVSRPRNPRMQTMLRFVGFGDSAGSGFPSILSAWDDENWPSPVLEEDTILNQVTLTLVMKKQAKKTNEEKRRQKTADKKPPIKNADKKPPIKTADKKPPIKTADKKIGEKTIKHRARVEQYLKRNKMASTAEIAEYLGLSDRRTKEILYDMDNVEAMGANKNRTYKLNEM